MDDRPVDDTRERILVAARACFERFGIDRTRMDDVAVQSGVSRTNLYYYFPNKEELFKACISAATEDFDTHFNTTLPISGPVRRLVVERFAQGIERSHQLGFFPAMIANSGAGAKQALQRSLSSVLDIELRYWRKLWAYARETGVLRPDLDEESTLTWILVLQGLVTTNREFVVGDDGDLRAFANTFVANAILNDHSTSTI